MAGRRGARSGRGWDAIPPRSPRRVFDEHPPDEQLFDGQPFDEHPPGESFDDAAERGNVPARRRRGSPGGFPGGRSAGSRSTGFGSGGFGSAGSGSEGSGSEGSGSAGFGSAGFGSAGFGSANSGPEGSGLEGSGSAGSGSAGSGSEGGRSEDGRSQGGRFRGGRSQGGRPAGGRGTEQSEAEQAREICLRKLALRPCSRAELAKALATRGISAEVIAEVLDRYDEVGLIDDAAFARAWVSSRHHGRGLARRALANELRQRGVASEVAGEALEIVDDEEEAATARALVDRKLRTTSGAPDAVFRRLVGMLARKGYSAGVAIRAVKDALAARDAEAAEFAEQIDPDAMSDE